MEKLLKIRIVFFSTIFFGVFLAGAAAVSQDISQSTDQTYIVVVPHEFPPQYTTDEQGNTSGFAIDVMNAIAIQEGIQIRYVIKETWGEVFDELRNGKADIIPNLGISSARESYATFTVPVETFSISLFARANTEDISDLNSLSDRKVGVVINNVGEQILEGNEDLNLVKFLSFQEALFELLSGSIDAIAYPEPVAMQLIRTARVEDRIKVVGEALREVKRAIAVHKDKHELFKKLNDGAAVFIQTEEYRELYKKWYGTPTPYWTVLRLTILMGSMLFVVILIMSIWRYRSVVGLNQRIRQSEERYELAIAGSNDGIFDWDILNGDTFRSERYKEIIGFKDQELPNQFESFGNALHPEDMDYVQAAIADHLENRTPYDVEYRLLHKSGQYIWVRAKGQAIWNDEGKAYRMAGSIRDITPEVEYREALREARDEAEKANVSKSSFISSMNHDLRTPLNAIIGFSEIMDTGMFGKMTNPKYAEYIHDINKSSKYLLGLVNDVLEASAIESGNKALTLENVNLGEILVECHALLHKLADDKDISFELHIEEGIPALRADKKALMKIFMNIASNAIKFTNDKGSVTIKAEVADQNHVIKFIDSGVGIPPESISSVIEPFTRVTSDPFHSHQEGTGLGLSIAHSLVKLHHGTMTIDSEVGKGTTVTVTLPSKVLVQM